MKNLWAMCLTIGGFVIVLFGYSAAPSFFSTSIANIEILTLNVVLSTAFIILPVLIAATRFSKTKSRDS